ncbi:hypothetical protein R3P38DRAFT_1290018 [Favolaschia claudopus]|uniref:Uncharacterized protein n=1 Tax=Favolaschia claudopus TaxID=2862362 RepID=A0AAW0B033_9AGAR
MIPQPHEANTPTDIQWILPEVDAFVTFTIDPVASLSEGAQDVPEAVAACKKLVNKQYVGLIAKWRGIYMPWERYNSCYLRFVQHGEPEGRPEEFILPSMSVPVLPVTRSTHVSGRPPLQPSKCLPWSDCYISISAGACVRTPPSFTVDPPEWKLDREESIRLHFLMADDIEEMQDKQRAFKSKGQAENNIDTTSATSRPADDDAASTFSAAPSSSYCSESSAESVPEEGGDVDADIEAETGSLNELVQDLFSSDSHDKAMITVHFTHDLSKITELHKRSDYLKEVEAIERIEKELAPPSRIEEYRAIKLQNEINRAKEMDSALYDEQTIDMLIDHDELVGNPPSTGETRPEIPSSKAVARPAPKIQVSTDVADDDPRQSVYPRAMAIDSTIANDSLVPLTKTEEHPLPARETVSHHSVQPNTEHEARTVQPEEIVSKKHRNIIIRVGSKLKKRGAALHLALKRFRPVAVPETATSH